MIVSLNGIKVMLTLNVSLKAHILLYLQAVFQDQGWRLVSFVKYPLEHSPPTKTFCGSLSIILSSHFKTKTTVGLTLIQAFLESKS